MKTRMIHRIDVSVALLLKATLLTALAVCTVMFAAFAVRAQQAPRASQQKEKAAGHYSCPMHPEVKSAKAGRCPKCGMDLRFVKAEDEAPATQPAGRASIDPGREANVGGASSRMSIPDSEVVNQDGQKLHFYTDLVKGKTVVINFIFTTCTTICPPLGATFARVQKELGERTGRDVHFISISVDPATDTPERLKAWGAKFHAGPGWTFITGDKPVIDDLLRSLAASSARREDHSPTVLIGNEGAGQWTRTYGLAKPSQLVSLINEAIEGKLEPSKEASSK